MDKLIKSIPKDHMDIINAKAEARGTSSSSYIRELIQKDAGVIDFNIKDVPYATAQKIKRNAAAAGLTVADFLFRMAVNGVISNE